MSKTPLILIVVVIALVALAVIGYRYLFPPFTTRLVFQISGETSTAGQGANGASNAITEAINQRLNLFEIKRARTRINANQLQVDLPRVSAEKLDQVKAAIQFRSQLEVVLVNDRSDLFDRLAEMVKQGDSIRVREDSYSGPNGTEVQYKTLAAATRDLLENHLTRIGPKLQLPPAHRLLVGNTGSDAHTFELFLVTTNPVVDGRSVRSATLAWNEFTAKPEAEIQFNEQGTKAFAQATRQQVGRRMAIIVNDLVRFAPVVMSEIAGGKARIILGGNQTDDAAFREAQLFVAALGAGRLTQQVAFVRAEKI